MTTASPFETHTYALISTKEEKSLQDYWQTTCGTNLSRPNTNEFVSTVNIEMKYYFWVDQIEEIGQIIQNVPILGKRVFKTK